MLLIREPVRRPSESKIEGATNTEELIAFYRDNSKTIIFHHIGNLSLLMTGFAFVFWSITFFVRVHDMDASHASQIFGWIYIFFGPLGPLLMPILQNIKAKKVIMTPI